MYKTLRTLHLLFGLFSLPFLLMYGVSAVQMAHSQWFRLKPETRELTIDLASGLSDGRRVARELMERRVVKGEISSVQDSGQTVSLRIAVPGSVYEVKYARETGSTHVKASVAGFLGMLNRLHHAAGLWHEHLPLKIWAVFVLLVSVATLGLGVTGLWMWWIRRQERTLGLILIGANLIFSITVLGLLRSGGP